MTSPKQDPQIIMGVDPGDVTGMCTLTVDEDSMTFLSGETLSLRDVASHIIDTCPDAVVVENYIIRPHRPQNATQALKTIGVVEYLCNERGIPMIMQQPSIPERYKDQAKEYVAGRHARSACAHVLYYLDRLRYGK